MAHAPGWDAIGAALARIYPGVAPVHLAPGMPGGGVEGITAYPADGHWHLVAYGLSDLYGTGGGDPGVSGWGFELTIRVARRAGETGAPRWAFDLLERLARLTRARNRRFEVGDRIQLGGPLDGHPSTRLEALTVVRDPQLGVIDTPNGAVEFRQLLGVASHEVDFLRAGCRDAVLEHLGDGNPLLVTDVRRRAGGRR
jgi:suppressor of fused